MLIRSIGEYKANLNDSGNYPLTVGTQLSQGVDVRLAGAVPRYWMGKPPKDINMRLPDQILHTSCFIAHRTKEIKFGGTAFIVSIKGRHDNAFLYLVTAKHVAEAVEHGPFVVGLNQKSGSRAYLDVDEAKWYYHPTEPTAVDAAATIFTPERYDSLNVEWVHETMFATPDVMRSAGIGIGDEIAVIGLFTRFWGKEQHVPIARIGNLAMLPNDRVPVKDFDPMEAYLAEGRSIGGLSGSPVFVRQTVNMTLANENGSPVPFAGTGQIYFLGLMHGHWDVPKKVLDKEGVEAAEMVNMGVSIVVPAQKIKEILYQQELVEMRNEVDKEIANESGPTQDSELKKPDHVFTKQDFETALKKASRKIVPRAKDKG